MRRLRRVFQCWVRWLGPPLMLVSMTILLGLGVHAAVDWHHHGASGVGFFHLHAHIGHHQHDHGSDHHDGHLHDHDHGEPNHGEPDRSDPSAPLERQDETFTIAFGVGQAPPPAIVAGTDHCRGELREPPFILDADLRIDDESWSPRGPPV